MRKIEKFLNSDFYPLLIAVIGVIAWVLPSSLLWLNYTLVSLILLVGVLILSFYSKTKYVIPIILSLAFMINMQDMGVEQVQGISIFHFMVLLAIAGLVVHFIRFRHKVRFDWIAFSLLLIAISYLIPMIYMPFSGMLLSISLSGFIYLAIYLFVKNTAQVKTDEVFVYFFYASLQLMAIMAISMGQGFYELYQNGHELSEIFRRGFITSWGRTDYGFGNINDLIIHLTILSSGIFYKLIKKPKNYSYWLVVILSLVLVVLSSSRAGFLSFASLMLVYFLMIFAYGEKHQMIVATTLFVLAGVLLFFARDYVAIYVDAFMGNGVDDIDGFSSGRITLYKQALDVFREYPLFGGGWAYVFEADNVNRIQIYHSTIFHTLAVTGLFGMFAVGTFTIATYVTILRRLKLNTLIFLVPWIMTTLHGLIDNTIHMVIYMGLAAIMFAAITEDEEVVTQKDQIFFDYLMIDQIYKSN